MSDEMSAELPPAGVGIELPKITPLIAKILERYPDGGQILKVPKLL